MNSVCPTTATAVATDRWFVSAEELQGHVLRAHAAARALLGCDHLAEDAVQEALVTLWRQPERPPELRGWLVRAVVHRARHLHRTARRRQSHEHRAADHCALHRGCDNPLHHAYAHELGERLESALSTLPAEQRAAFALYVDTGLDYRGIAERLQLPIGTVRSRLSRARAALLAALDGSDGNGTPAAADLLADA